MKIEVDNEKREIYVNGVKSKVTWGLLEDERRKTEYGIDIMAEAMYDIRMFLIREFKIYKKSDLIALSFLLCMKVKLKWDCDA